MHQINNSKLSILSKIVKIDQLPLWNLQIDKKRPRFLTVTNHSNVTHWDKYLAVGANVKEYKWIYTYFFNYI
jgi:hypothetical protein